MSGTEVVLTAFAVAAALQIDRKGFLQLLTALPLVACAATAFLLGDPGAMVLLGVPLTLLWLLGLNVGAHLPDHDLAGSIGVTGAAIFAGGGRATVESACLALCLLPAVAALGRRLETHVEGLYVGLADRAARRVDAGGDPFWTNVVGLAPSSLAAGVLASGTALAGGLLVHGAVRALPAASTLGPMALLVGGAVPAVVVVAASRFEQATVVGGAAAVVGLSVLLMLRLLAWGQVP